MPQYFGQLPTIEPSWKAIPPVTSVETDDRHITLICGDTRLRVTILAKNLVRVRFAPTGEFLPRRSWAVTRDDSEWQEIPFTFEESPEVLRVRTGKINVTIGKNPVKIEFFDGENRPFARDREGGLGWRAGSVAGWKVIEPEEHFYGFGERTGLLDRLGSIATNWTVDAVDYDTLTDEMYQAIPFFIALRPALCYGLFLHSTYWSRFDLGVKEMGFWRMETHSPELDYYLIYGRDPAEVTRTYAELTGKMPLPPRWALGYHQSRWGYDSEDLVRSIAREFRDRQIPCDAIHLDIDYMHGFRVFTWSQKRFPDPYRLINEIRQQGFKIITIVDPGIKYEPEADYAVFDEALQKDYLIRKPEGQLFHGYVWPDKAVFPDFVDPDVRDWWGNWHRVLTDAGVSGIWNDMNEPSMSDRPFGDKGQKIWFPLDSCQGSAKERATHAETHNLYGLLMARASFEAMERQRENDRSFILTRSGYAGIQRWSSVWLGDNQATWEHLEQSLPMLCNMGLSGVAFVGCDVGGFAGNTTAELFTRWMQVGILYPLARAHSAMGTIRREPWVYGEEVEAICRKYIELRYRLIPYLYTLFREAATTGAPILRPLLYHYPDNPKVYELHDQVMLGSSIMAAPICRPGVEARSVYLPEGIWYDWWTGERLEGGRYILALAPLDVLPLYAKEGAIVPLYPVCQHLDEIPASMTVRIYPGEGNFTLYEDDGHSFDYRRGIYSTTRYSVSTRGEEVVIEVSDRRGEYNPGEREISIEVIGKGEQHFTDDGTAKRWTF